MYITYESLELEIKGQTAFIMMNRPKQLNALNSILIEELYNCLKQVSADENVRIVVIKGNGGAFSAGGDIKEMLQLSDEEEFFNIMEKINNLIVTLYSMPQLTIAAIEGAAAGLGLSIALASDYIICADNGKLAMNFIGIGLVPDGGGHFLLEHRLGEVKAKQLIWEGAVLSAVDALNIGLIDEKAATIQESVDLCVDRWSSKPVLAMIKTKKIYAELNRETLLKSLELEKHAQWAMRQTKDHQEGIRAFVEKRHPKFCGE